MAAYCWKRRHKWRPEEARQVSADVVLRSTTCSNCGRNRTRKIHADGSVRTEMWGGGSRPWTFVSGRYRGEE